MEEQFGLSREWSGLFGLYAGERFRHGHREGKAKEIFFGEADPKRSILPQRPMGESWFSSAESLGHTFRCITRRVGWKDDRDARARSKSGSIGILSE